MQYKDDMEKLAYDYMNEGRQAIFDNKMKQAARLFQNALHLFKQVENFERYTAVLNMSGVVYAALGNETMAVDCYMEGLACAKEHHFVHLLSPFYNNIGSRYQELGEHEKAIQYFLKSVEALQNEEAKKVEQYEAWKMVSYMNLLSSYEALGQYKLAEQYLKLAEPLAQGEAGERYRYTFLILQCSLYWWQGHREFVYEHLEQLVESAELVTNTSDYVQDMMDLCSLLRCMKEYENWKRVILAFEQYANEQDTVYSRLTLTEMWMLYYDTIGEQEKYVSLCVEHTRLYQKQRKVLDKERALAIDMKIELQEKEMERRHAEKKSNFDALTGLGNRYLLKRDIRQIVENTTKCHRVAVGLLDVDCFKQMNDTYGHLKGDECLKKIADILEHAVRGRGRAYRFGGDEFVLLLEHGEAETVREVAEEIRNVLHDSGMDNVNSTVASEVTISQGYTCFMPLGEGKWDDVLERADKVLYEVKQNGRNNYRIAGT